MSTVQVESHTAPADKVAGVQKSTIYTVLGFLALVIVGGLLAKHFFYKSKSSTSAAEPTVEPLEKTPTPAVPGEAPGAAAGAAAAGAGKAESGVVGDASAAAVAAGDAAADAAASLAATGGAAAADALAGKKAAGSADAGAVKPVDLADETVPWWQRELAKLPAMQVCKDGKYKEMPFPYDHRNDFYDAEAHNELSRVQHGTATEDADLYVTASKSQGDSASEIYSRATSSGISLLNRGAIRDPEKMLPTAKAGDEVNRLFKVGASISDIQKHLPKTTDLMRMARDRPSGLSFQIPAEKPPLYTEGINCERRARIPTRASDKNQLFCINPIDPREYFDYRPHPLLDSVLADGGRFPNGGGFGAEGDVGPTGASTSAAQSSAAAAQSATTSAL